MESDEDTDPSSDGSDDDAHQAGGPTGGIVSSEVPYVASKLDYVAVCSLVLPQEEGSHWGFDAETLLLGQRFPSKEAVQQAIAQYALSISRMYRVHRSNPGYYAVKCVVEGCLDKVSAHRAKIFGSVFAVKAVTDHTCELSEPLRQYRNVTSAYVANLIKHLVVADVSVPPKLLMSEVANQVGYPVSYGKVRRAKQKVIESVYGTYEEAYNLVPRLFHQFAESNSGTYINNLEREDAEKGPNRFILDRVI